MKELGITSLSQVTIYFMFFNKDDKMYGLANEFYIYVHYTYTGNMQCNINCNYNWIIL